MVNLRLRSLLSILISTILICSCARSEGVINVGGSMNIKNIGEIPNQIPSAAIDEVIAYFEALNLALDSGDLTSLTSGRFSNCGCLQVAQNIAEIWQNSNLLDGDYLIKNIVALRIGAADIEIKVLVTRTEVLKVDRNSGSVESWPAKDISTNFSLENRSGNWIIVGSNAG